MRVVCRIASESVTPVWHSGRLALSAGSRPPQETGKSLSPYETDAIANATPPRRPDHHIANMYSLEIGGKAVVSLRNMLVKYEPT